MGSAGSFAQLHIAIMYLIPVNIDISNCLVSMNLQTQVLVLNHNAALLRDHFDSS